jgi:hypothetical protein
MDCLLASQATVRRAVEGRLLEVALQPARVVTYPERQLPDGRWLFVFPLTFRARPLGHRSKPLGLRRRLLIRPPGRRRARAEFGRVVNGPAGQMNVNNTLNEQP